MTTTMRKTFTTLFLMGALCLNVWGQVLLPIEVLGQAGTIADRTFTLTQETVDQSTRLWLQVNSLDYENKGSVKINNEPWYALNHNSVDMQWQEKARGGMVHGGFNTIRFSIPAEGLQAGTNTIRFRFDRASGISIGYRIVRLNLLDEGGKKLLPQAFFTEDDPQTWVGPYTNTAAIDSGRYLWYNAQLWNNDLAPGTQGFWYNYTIPASKLMRATCSNCHTQDGRDLELFSYSNHSIIERSKFHQLTEEQGKLIASYIRSLSAEHDNVNRKGRPWNPPYQPGPQLEGKPIDEWAAGAGLDAVLDKDADMLPYMFPEGVNEATISSYYDSDKISDWTEVPLAIQFPDWKRWLPMIHPMDAYEASYYDNPTLRFQPERGYATFRSGAEALPKKADGITADMGSLSAAELQQFKDDHYDFRRETRFFHAQRLDGTWSPEKHWRSEYGDAWFHMRDFGSGDTISREFAQTSMARWFAVKNFEIMQEFNLQDQAPDYLNSVDQPSQRQWFHDEQLNHVFAIVPHFTACSDNNGATDFGNDPTPRFDCQQFYGQPTETGQFESTNWYQMQMVLSGGNGNQNWNTPVDYNYHPQFILRASQSSGVYEPMRYYFSMNHLYQVKSWSQDTNPNDGRGFRIRVQGPWIFLGKKPEGGGNLFYNFEPNFWPALLDEVKPGLTRLILNAQMRQFLTEVQKPQNALSNWARYDDPNNQGGNNSSQNLDSESKSAVQDITGNINNSPAPLYADHMYWVIQAAAELGVDCEIIQELIDWAQAAWPLIDYEQFRTMPRVTLNIAKEGQGDHPNDLVALAGNVGDSPTYQWWINGVPSGTDKWLSSDDLVRGDWVKCQVVSSDGCMSGLGLGLVAIDSMQVLTPNVKVYLNQQPWDYLLAEQTVVGDSVRVEVDFGPDSTLGGLPGFSPAIWLDATKLATEDGLTDGDKVTTWSDQSGNGVDATETNINRQPTYRATGFNGLPAVVFGETSHTRLELADSGEDAFLDANWTIFVVGQVEASQPVQADIIGNKSGSGSGWYFKVNQNGRPSLSAGGAAVNGSNYGLPKSFLTSLVTYQDQNMSLWFNGSLELDHDWGPSNDLSNGNTTYLGYNTNTNRHLRGPISEVMVFDYALPEAQRQKIEGYLAQKWNLRPELPSVHPYRNRSPFEVRMEKPDGRVVVFSSEKLTHQFAVTESDFGLYPFYADENENARAFHRFWLGADPATVSIAPEGETSQIAHELSAYPSPFDDHLRLRLYLPAPAQLQIQVLNHVGQSIWTKQATIESGDWEQDIATHNWPAGMYYISIFSSETGEKETKKVVKYE